MPTPGEQWTPPASDAVEVLPAGRWWDAVHVPAPIGEHALDLLGDNSGAVIEDTHGTTLYWLIPPGTDTPPGLARLPGVHVLGGGLREAVFLGVPPVHRTTKPGTYWRIPLTAERYLTAPVALGRAISAAVRLELGPWAETGHPL